MNQKEENYEKLIKWTGTNLKPKCNSIVKMVKDIKREQDIKAEVERFEALLKNMDKMLAD